MDIEVGQDSIDIELGRQDSIDIQIPSRVTNKKQFSMTSMAGDTNIFCSGLIVATITVTILALAIVHTGVVQTTIRTPVISIGIDNFFNFTSHQSLNKQYYSILRTIHRLQLIQRLLETSKLQTSHSRLLCRKATRGKSAVLQWHRKMCHQIATINCCKNLEYQ